METLIQILTENNFALSAEELAIAQEAIITSEMSSTLSLFRRY